MAAGRTAAGAERRKAPSGVAGIPHVTSGELLHIGFTDYGPRTAYRQRKIELLLCAEVALMIVGSMPGGPRPRRESTVQATVTEVGSDVPMSANRRE